MLGVCWLLYSLFVTTNQMEHRKTAGSFGLQSNSEMVPSTGLWPTLLPMSGIQGRNQSSLQFLSYLFPLSQTKPTVLNSSLSLATFPALLVFFPHKYIYIYVLYQTKQSDCHYHRNYVKNYIKTFFL